MHQAWASKGYRHVYLTARPDHMTAATGAWFASHGFPTGSFHLSQTSFG